MSGGFPGATTSWWLSLGGRLRVTFVIAVARGLAHLSPLRLRLVLGFLRRGATPASYQQAAAARESVVETSVRCQGEGCLPRSIAAALLCRVEGVWPTWCVGVITSPLAAHAWLEAEGRIVDEPQGTDRFRVLMRVQPECSPAGEPGRAPESSRWSR